MPAEASVDGSCWQRPAGAAEYGEDRLDRPLPPGRQPHQPHYDGPMPWLSALPDGGYDDGERGGGRGGEGVSPPAVPRAAAGYDDAGAASPGDGGYGDDTDHRDAAYGGGGGYGGGGYDDGRDGGYDDRRDGGYGGGGGGYGAYDDEPPARARGRSRYANGERPAPIRQPDAYPTHSNDEPAHESYEPQPPSQERSPTDLAPPRRGRGLAAQARAMRAAGGQ